MLQSSFWTSFIPHSSWIIWTHKSARVLCAFQMFSLTSRAFVFHLIRIASSHFFICSHLGRAFCTSPYQAKGSRIHHSYFDCRPWFCNWLLKTRECWYLQTSTTSFVRCLALNQTSAGQAGRNFWRCILRWCRVCMPVRPKMDSSTWTWARCSPWCSGSGRICAGEENPDDPSLGGESCIKDWIHAESHEWWSVWNDCYLSGKKTGSQMCISLETKIIMISLPIIAMTTIIHNLIFVIVARHCVSETRRCRCGRPAAQCARLGRVGCPAGCRC